MATENVSSEGAMAKMQVHTSAPFYTAHPSAKIYWYTYFKAEETMMNLPKDIFLLPLRLKLVKGLIEQLRKLKICGYYQEFNDDNELKIIEKSLKDMVVKLEKKFEELRIKPSEFDPEDYSFEDCPMADLYLSLEDEEREYQL